MQRTPTRELADFLRTRRSRLLPEDVGLEPGPRRRVEGLRREEIALLAGVSTDYYQRIEQGRDVRPSDEVLDGLARALALTAEETRHLHALAGAARRPARRRRPVPEVVPVPTQRLLATISGPAVVVGRHLDLLAWNPLAGALLGDLRQLPLRERNLLSLLLDPVNDRDRTCPDRRATAAELTAMLRSAVDTDPDHPRAVELVGELAVRSAEFRTFWARHDVGETTRGRMRLEHPLLGELRLDWDAYPLPGKPGPMLVAFTADEHSPTGERLQLLAGLLAAAPDARTSPIAEAEHDRVGR